MMPDADMVALSGSVSNHWSRKSAALMVMSWMNAVCWRRGSFAEVAQQAAQRQGVARVRPPRVDRGEAQDGLDEARHLDHQPAVLGVRLGVAGRPAAQLAHRLVVVVGAPQVVAVEGREGAVEGQDLEAVPGSVEVADDLRPQQAHDVARRR